MLEKFVVATELLPKQLPERAYGWVVDATGSSEGLRAAVTMCKPEAPSSSKSTVHGFVR
jgi:hypothetical protein